MNTETRKALGVVARKARRAGVSRETWMAAVEARLLGSSGDVAGLDDPSLDEAWQHEETLGWAYQFFNCAVEKKKARTESAAPRDAAELALRNQFFTPRYVVEFLAQNTLGAMLGLKGDYFCEEAAPVRCAHVRLTEAGVTLPEARPPTVLDPACGSGHFLLYALDLLVRTGWAVQRALDSLWGVEIDADLACVARRALELRAVRHGASAPVARHILVATDTLGVLRREWALPVFDVVLQNPPFGACAAADKGYLKKHYPRSAHELACAFVERGFELVRPGGMLGALTTRCPFFLLSSTKWRREFMLKPPVHMTVFADLGYGVLDNAMVEVAAYCLHKRPGGAFAFGEAPPQATQVEMFGP